MACKYGRVDSKPELFTCRPSCPLDKNVRSEMNSIIALLLLILRV